MRRPIVLALAILFGCVAHKSTQAPEIPQRNDPIIHQQQEPASLPDTDIQETKPDAKHTAHNLKAIRHFCEIAAICLWASISGAVALRISSHRTTTFFRSCASIAFLFVLITLFAFVIKSQMLIEFAILVVLGLHLIVLVKELLVAASVEADNPSP